MISLCQTPVSFARADENTRLLPTGPLSPFIIRGRGAKKAPPTVSLTNAVASCVVSACAVLAADTTTSTSTTQDIINVIPFPSMAAAVPFPTSSHSSSNSEDELEAGWGLGMPRARVRPRVSQVELRHRRSRARLAQSPIARKDAPRGRSRSPDVPDTPCGGGSGGGGGGGRKRGQLADVQLLAMVYRTVSSRLGCTDPVQPPDGEGGGDAREVMEAQERLLVQRLSESMVDLGCSPFPIVHARAGDPEPSIVALEYPSLAGRSRESSPPPPPPPSSPCVVAREPVEPRVLTMPQLVAKLMLRHGERARRRAASRVRTPGGGGERAGDGPAAKSSPLAMCIDGI